MTAPRSASSQRRFLPDSRLGWSATQLVHLALDSHLLWPSDFAHLVTTRMSSTKRRRDGASCWQQRAYPVAALTLSSIFLVGLATKFDFFSSGHLPDLLHKNKPVYDFPDFNKVTQVYTLSEGELGLNDPNRRVLLIGDLHGMNKSLQKGSHEGLMFVTSSESEQPGLPVVGVIDALNAPVRLCTRLNLSWQPRTRRLAVVGWSSEYVGHATFCRYHNIRKELRAG
ncbi:uncharacterized protein C8Q71DRAFT_537597 [Rhodofomes roseus]|uniref:Calcineurin-like phosphoesterase domain-containing protein n=1 Tax=Rhodofomes roseus TaxID=34475 RepID=A0ABQ8KKB7_9APHY|nr:uncharacterized protein C8Q71DRAFT_537597 [Rhodofomes roseus]KAH9838598.1 hypothetical protein C8Q71DRAFT_537597 [Rhodofomes roseus]